MGGEGEGFGLKSFGGSKLIKPYSQLPISRAWARECLLINLKDA